MKQIIFDSGPMISLTLNSLLWIIEPLKEKFQGDFLIPPKVKEEIIDKPLTTKKYKLEAFQVLPYLNKGTLKVINHPELESKTKELLNLVDNTFQAKGKFMQLVHFADMQVVAAGLLTNADALVIDEYTTRLLIENPRRIIKRMEKKLHTKCTINEENLKKLQEQLKNLRVLRSVELITIAYELGILDRYLFEGEKRFVKKPRKTLLEGALWGLKLNGCAVSENEIEDVLNLEQ